ATRSSAGRRASPPRILGSWQSPCYSMARRAPNDLSHKPSPAPVGRLSAMSEEALLKWSRCPETGPSWTARKLGLSSRSARKWPSPRPNRGGMMSGGPAVVHLPERIRRNDMSLALPLPRAYDRRCMATALPAPASEVHDRELYRRYREARDEAALDA